MMAKLLQYWFALEHRERVTIVTGFLLVLMAAGYMLFDRLWVQRSALVQERDELMAEAAWMQEQAELAERLINSCSETQLLSLPPEELIELLATRSSLNVQNMDSNGSEIALQLSTADGNSILQFIHQSACQGFTLNAVQIQQEATGSTYLGNVEFRREG